MNWASERGHVPRPLTLCCRVVVLSALKGVPEECYMGDSERPGAAQTLGERPQR